MKRKLFYINLLFIFLMGSSLFAQYAQVDFEEGGLGADWEWTVTENDDNPPLEFIGNPDASGINTSETVAQFIARENGNAWALCFTDSNGEFTFDADNSTFTIMIHKPVISNVAIKFEGSSEPVEIQIANTVTNEWEELTFDFSGSIGNTYNRLVIIPDFEERTQDNTIYFDNIQLPEGTYEPIPEPETAAPTPTVPPENVISLFSNAYSDVLVDTWSTEWDQADVQDVQIQDNDTKLYTNLVFAGIEFATETIDASEMTHFHLDMWTPDSTEIPAEFKIKLVDYGADGAWGGDDDVEHELTFDETTNPPLESETWISFDIPLADFSNLVTVEHLAQLIISGDPNTYYIDNVFFHSGGTQSVPEVAAPTPTVPEENVISLFSNAYTDVPVDTWSADWDEADVSDIQIDGDDVKFYTNVNFAGIEFISQTIDATDMTHFHLNVWTPDNTYFPYIFKVKLVDFGADGAWGGGDDVEHELIFDEAVMESETWVTLDIPLADFENLTTREHLAQLVITCDMNTIYLDNIYFYNEANEVIDDISDSSLPIHSLGNNYPNPFNPETSIDFTLTQPGFVSIKIFDIKGRLVDTLLNSKKSADTYKINWNTKNVSSGVYFYRLEVNKKAIDTKRMILIK